MTRGGVFLIRGGRRLEGRIAPGGAKNAILPIMAASVLTDETVSIENVPRLLDVEVFSEIVRELGGKVVRENGRVTIQGGTLRETTVPFELAQKIRASVLLMGPILARFGRVEVPVPGGCDIGDRPIDQHLKAFESMGAKVERVHGQWVLSCRKLKGARVDFDVRTVTGTENVLMAAVLAEGTTVITNAAMEPEVVDLARCLKEMGAAIEGEGTPVITVEGVNSLKGVSHTVLPDRIEAATLLLAGVITGGSVFVEGVRPELMEAVLDKVDQAGAVVTVNDGGVGAAATGRLKSVNVSTSPFPGFPTDVQAQFMACMCIADSVSTIEENIFENRFRHVAELRRLGADITVSGRVAVVRGVERLQGAPVTATDLRASAGLVLAGLVAEGETEVREIVHLDRGYESLEEKLNALGAEIMRVEGEKIENPA
ncbi:MAG: UDP-N-acetylglucosamine 1-carboxyvinyltransferase [Deltaproteobacteria bacterium]|nr:MAG: UDP-N-acetylglucosamine 1-carboxyvinyltransferase [Deltaproteobacteria bacterium]